MKQPIHICGGSPLGHQPFFIANHHHYLGYLFGNRTDHATRADRRMPTQTIPPYPGPQHDPVCAADNAFSLPQIAGSINAAFPRDEPNASIPGLPIEQHDSTTISTIPNLKREARSETATNDNDENDRDTAPLKLLPLYRKAQRFVTSADGAGECAADALHVPYSGVELDYMGL